MAAYATVAELTAKLGSEPANAQDLLDRASRDVDVALLCKVYDATNVDVVAALKDATLEQVAQGLAQGDTAGLGGAQPTSFTIGRLSAQRDTGHPGQPYKVGRLWVQAWQVLQVAGLTGSGPQTA